MAFSRLTAALVTVRECRREVDGYMQCGLAKSCAGSNPLGSANEINYLNCGTMSNIQAWTQVDSLGVRGLL
jgi:hypothetical protein